MMQRFIAPLLIVTQLSFGNCIQQGPNRCQNAPTLTNAVMKNNIITVRGALCTFKRCATYIIQFFGNTSNRNPLTEGADFLGQTTVTTNNTGVSSFIVSLPPTPNTYSFVSATATLVLCDGTLSDTSIFSTNIAIK